MFLLLISFIAGVLTVLAPCILPLLPVIIGGSVSGDGTSEFNKKKALTIVLSLGISVIIFTFVLKVSTLFINIPPSTWTIISGSIVFILGILTLFPKLLESDFLARLNAKSNQLMGQGYKRKSFWGDVVIGASLGPIFSTCSPTYFIVLATVLPVSPIRGLAYMLAYVIGLCLSLLLVSLVGQKIMNKLGIVADERGKFKKALGVIFIVVGIAIMFGLDKKTQVFLLDKGFFDITQVEQKLLEKNKSSGESETSTVIENKDEASGESYPTPEQKKSKYKKVSELSTIDGYINTGGKMITLESLKGKVVLLDIWTYSCINCQRTIPYIVSWYEKYKDQGLEVVGLHTPEFAFEKVQENVEKAVKKFGILYPVVMDNDYSTWNALGNQYWPRKYLVDIDGYIIYDHIGEGGYEETERAIQYALRERALRMGMETEISNAMSNPANVPSVDSSKVGSPEIYFGSSRNQYLTNGRSGVSGEQVFQMPSTIYKNNLNLVGKWNITPEYAENLEAAAIVFNYEAKSVYMAAGSMKGVVISIYKDDVFVKDITVKDEDLYSLIDDSSYGTHTLRIVIKGPGLKAFTFTFG